MSDSNDITAIITTEEPVIDAIITTEEPAVAATLDDLRYLVFEGKKGDTGDSAYEEAVKLGFVGTEEEWIASLKGEKGDPGEDGVSFVHAYLDEGVVRYVYAYKEHETDDIYTSTAMAQDIENGILPLLHYSPEDDVFDYFELDRYDLSHASRVVYFRSKDYLLSVDSTGAYTLSDRPQGGDVANAVLYTPQTLTPAQQEQARGNIGAGTYSKPSGGIPDSDIASAATWNAKGTYSKPSGGIPKSDLASDVRTSLGKADSALQEHQSLDAYRTASAQDAIDAAQDAAIAAKYTKPASGIPASDLASDVQTSLEKADTALQQHQDISGKANTADLAAVATSGSYNDLSDKPTIPTVPTAEISANTAARHTHSNKTLLDTYTQTEANLADAVSKKHSHSNKTVLDGITAAKVQNWDGKGTYSKPSGGIPDSDIASAAVWNTKGTYSKPSGGIPKSDLASAVQTSLGKADTALQQHQSLTGYATETWVQNRGYQTAAEVQTAIAAKYTKPSTGIPKTDLASDVKASLGKADTALQEHQSLASYRTASAQDTIDAAQDQAISGKLSTTGNAYRSASIPMGELDSTSTATVMTATVDGITELRDGVCMWLRNGVVTSASGFTIDVNNLGAKPCYSSLAAESRSTTIFNVNYALLMIYNSTRVDGGCWDIVYGVDTNTTYTPPKLGFGYGTCTTAAATAAKTASISSYSLVAGGYVSIKFNYDVPANATLNITSKGAKAIYYMGSPITDGVIKAGDTATFVYSTYYHLISIDRDESGDDLPSVTASDNGKFLRVVSGAWAAQAVQTWQGGSY